MSTPATSKGPTALAGELDAELRRLHAENEALRADLTENEALRQRMADILRRTAVALRGPEPPLTRWSWHDLPERAAAAIAAIDVMQRAAQQAAESESPNARLTGPQRDDHQTTEGHDHA